MSISPTTVSPVAAQQAARAAYLKTGIDKDAAIGDPDHDAPRKAASPRPTAVSAAPSGAPASQAVASAVTTLNVVSPSPATAPATAAAAYGATTH